MALMVLGIISAVILLGAVMGYGLHYVYAASSSTTKDTTKSTATKSTATKSTATKSTATKDTAKVSKATKYTKSLTPAEANRLAAAGGKLPSGALSKSCPKVVVISPELTCTLFEVSGGICKYICD